MGIFQHFDGLSLTPADLRAKYGSQTGVWQAFGAPRRDETGYLAPLGYYEGLFDVLHAVILEHRRSFLDDTMCGEIVPIVAKRVPARNPSIVQKTHR